MPFPADSVAELKPDSSSGANYVETSSNCKTQTENEPVLWRWCVSPLQKLEANATLHDGVGVRNWNLQRLLAEPQRPLSGVSREAPVLESGNLV